MKHEFLIVSTEREYDRDARKPPAGDYDVRATADNNRDARERATSLAQSHPGAEFTIYTKGPTFRGEVKVDTDEPKQAPESRT